MARNIGYGIFPMIRSRSLILIRRGQAVVDHLLGKQYDGILISDFLSAYNKIQTKGKQRCLVHLLRDIKRVQEALWDQKEVQTFCQPGKISQEEFQRNRSL